jgi:hypothetical protein
MVLPWLIGWRPVVAGVYSCSHRVRRVDDQSNAESRGCQRRAATL